jgi:NDP-sugar pyrophosphorylase family protein
MVDWILDDLDAAGASEIVMIINEQSIALRDHVDRQTRRCPVRWIIETTPSSMHSFLRVLEELTRDGDEGPFLISTVDTVAPAGTFRRFVEAAARGPEADIVLALTTRIEDENPLRVEADPQGEAGAPILAFGDGRFATAGYYFVRTTVLREARAGRAAELTALRLFFRHLFDRGYRLSGVCMPDSVDVDRPSDIEAAERLLRARVS